MAIDAATIAEYKTIYIARLESEGIADSADPAWQASKAPGGDFDINVDAQMESLSSAIANTSLYDTGWIARSDWTNVHMGSSTTKNADSNVVHNLDSNLYQLSVKVLVSSDGTDNASITTIDSTLDSAVASTFLAGISVYQVDSDTLQVQTGTNGFNYISSAGSVATIDTEDWFYKIVVYKLS